MEHEHDDIVCLWLFFFLLRSMEGDVPACLSQEVDEDCASAILVMCLTT